MGEKRIKIKDHHDKVVSMAAAGRLAAEIAKSIGASKYGIEKYCERYQIKIRPPFSRSDLIPHLPTIRTSLANGTSQKDIAELMGCSIPTLRRFIKEHRLDNKAACKPMGWRPVRAETKDPVNTVCGDEKIVPVGGDYSISRILKESRLKQVARTAAFVGYVPKIERVKIDVLYEADSVRKRKGFCRRCGVQREKVNGYCHVCDRIVCHMQNKFSVVR